MYNKNYEYSINYCTSTTLQGRREISNKCNNKKFIKNSIDSFCVEKKYLKLKKITLTFEKHKNWKIEKTENFFISQKANTLVKDNKITKMKIINLINTKKIFNNTQNHLFWKSNAFQKKHSLKTNKPYDFNNTKIRSKSFQKLTTFYINNKLNYNNLCTNNTKY